MVAEGEGISVSAGVAAAATYEAWHAAGRRITVLGRSAFAVAKTGAGTPLLFLHGFPTSSADFRLAAAHIGARPWIAHDHIGFGASDKPGDFSYSLVDQADVALAVWRAAGATAGHLVAHDYGTSVATELLARRESGGLPIELLSVTFCNGSVHMDLAQPLLIQRLLAGRAGRWVAGLVNPVIFRRRLKSLFHDPARLDDAELDAMWTTAMSGGGRDVLAFVARYIHERRRLRHRWLPPLRRLDIPAHVLWGRHDPIAVPAIAERLAREIPRARLSWLEDAGHFPMIECPDAWADAVTAFVSGVENAS